MPDSTNFTPKRIDDRQRLSFKLDQSSEVARRVAPVDTGDMLVGVKWDAFALATPNNVTEVFTYTTGGLGGTTVATVTIVYTSGAKSTISTVVVVIP